MRIIALMLMVACGSSKETSEETEVTSELKELRVEPAEIQLSTDGDAPDEIGSWLRQDGDGREVLTDMVSWSVSVSAGSIDNDGLFTTAILNGGITTVTATHVGVEASATVTVVYEQDQVVGELDAGIVSAFASASPAAGDAPAIYYPPEAVTVPRNLNGLAFGWSEAEGTNVSRLRLRSGITDMRVYTEGSNWDTTADVWATIAASNTEGLVEISIASGTWDGANLTNVVEGPDMTLTVNRLDARGSVLYWEPDPEAGGGFGMGAGSIMRIPLARWRQSPSGPRTTSGRIAR